MSDSDYITVCANCFRASCWQGIFMCDEAKDAPVTEWPRSKLEKLGLEHPDYWDPEYVDIEYSDCPPLLSEITHTPKG